MNEYGVLFCCCLFFLWETILLKTNRDKNSAQKNMYDQNPTALVLFGTCSETSNDFPIIWLRVPGRKLSLRRNKQKTSQRLVLNRSGENSGSVKLRKWIQTKRKTYQECLRHDMINRPIQNTETVTEINQDHSLQAPRCNITKLRRCLQASARRRHSLMYVFPLLPQTGSKDRLHFSLHTQTACPLGRSTQEE